MIIIKRERLEKLVFSNISNNFQIEKIYYITKYNVIIIIVFFVHILLKYEHIL